MNSRLVTFRCLFLFLATAFARADEWKFPCPENEIARYTAYHVSEPIHIDGRLD